MSIVTIVGAGMMGTALCWPLRDNRHTVRLVGTPLDQDLIAAIRSTGVHPKLQRRVPDGVQALFHTELEQGLTGADVLVSGVSSFGVAWFADVVGPHLRPQAPV